MFFSLLLSQGIPLSQLPTGTTITIKESGIDTEFIVLKHGYPAAGNGRTLLLRKNLITGLSGSWGRDVEGHFNEYSGGAPDVWMNSTYLNTIDVSIREHIAAVTIPYTTSETWYSSESGGYTTSYWAATLSRKIFLLSLTEYGITGLSSENTEGSKIPYFNSDESRKSTAIYSTRSCYTSHNMMNWLIDTNGVALCGNINNQYARRPALTLPSSFIVIMNTIK